MGLLMSEQMLLYLKKTFERGDWKKELLKNE
jgi:hypothetical protein